MMGDTTMNQERLPVKIPMLALRGLVLFPNMVLHFDVGREKSVFALNAVMAKDRRIFLVAQKDIRNDNPSPDDLYKVGRHPAGAGQRSVPGSAGGRPLPGPVL